MILLPNYPLLLKKMVACTIVWLLVLLQQTLHCFLVNSSLIVFIESITSCFCCYSCMTSSPSTLQLQVKQRQVQQTLAWKSHSSSICCWTGCISRRNCNSTLLDMFSTMPFARTDEPHLMQSLKNFAQDLSGKLLQSAHKKVELKVRQLDEARSACLYYLWCLLGHWLKTAVLFIRWWCRVI